jgi:Phage tail tube protein
MQSSGALGTAPQWGDLLIGCGFAETVTATTRVDYVPSSTGLKTLTIWAYYNGRLEKVVFAAGTFKLSLAVGQVPSLDFTFTGLVSSVVAGAAPAATLTAWIRGEAVGPVATTALSMGAVTYSAGAITGGSPYPFKSLDIDMANDVQDLALVQAESVAIYGREPTASMVADFGATQHAAWKTDMHAGTPRAFGLVHGSVSTKKVGIYAPVGVITNVEDQVDRKVILDKLDLTLRPSTLNDELRIFCI